MSLSLNSAISPSGLRTTKRMLLLQSGGKVWDHTHVEHHVKLHEVYVVETSPKDTLHSHECKGRSETYPSVL